MELILGQETVTVTTGFVVMAFLLTICGFLVCHADFKPSLLYATLTTEIMLPCYGIVKSLIGLLYTWMPIWKNISMCPGVSSESSL